MKKVLALVLTVALLVTLPIAISFANEPFKDLPKSHWGYENIMQMAEEGIIAGYPDGTFKPEATVTYGEFIKMVAAATKVDVPQAKAGEHWATRFYQASLDNEYFMDIDIQKTSLDRPISRAYMALIASSVLVDVKEYGPHSEILNSITDVEFKTPYEFYITKAYGMGVLSGYPDKTFKPDGTLTRAEAASVISRMKSKFEGGELPGPVITPEPIVTPDPVEAPDPEEDLNPNSPDFPLIDTSRFDPSAPAGTYMARMFNDDGDITQELTELSPLLSQQFPEDGQALFTAIQSFAFKDMGDKSIGTRKQYVNGWPIMINRVDNLLMFFVFPKDFEDEYWETTPGQVNEFFI